MERKTLFTSLAIVVLGLGLMVGVILFLRARNAPATDVLVPIGGSNAPPGTTALPPVKKGSVPPFTPSDQIPMAAPFKEGDPEPEPQPEVLYQTQPGLPNPLQP